jgi:hypothetical protein
VGKIATPAGGGGAMNAYELDIVDNLVSPATILDRGITL